MSTIATSPDVHQEAPTIEESAVKLYRLLEEHFDEMGLCEAERDERYTRAALRVSAQDDAGAKSAG